MARAGI